MISQDDTGSDSSDVALQQVRAKACDITNVVADVVSDGGGVAGIILRDVRFGFTNQVSAHISSLGVDAAANAVEHRDHRAAKRVA